MGKKYTTDEIEVGGHMIDASMMTSLNTVVTDSANYMTALPSHTHPYLPLTGGSLTGPLSITGNGSYLGNWGYDTLTLKDTSGYAGINFRNSNTSILQRMRAGSIDMQWAYSTNASGPGTGSYTEGMKLSGNSLTAYGDMRAPSFYDSSNTGYYVNPASTSNFNVVNSSIFSGTISTTGDGQNNTPFKLSSDYNSYMVAAASNTWGLFWAGNNGARYGTNGLGGPGNIWSNSTNPNEFVFVGSDSTKWTVHGTTGKTWQAGTGQSATDFRAPIFYDSNDTGYYVNPASTSNLNALNVSTINRNPVVQLSGDVTGSATMTNLGSININAVVNDDSHKHSFIQAGGTGPSTEDLNAVADAVSTGQLSYRGYNSSSTNKPPANDNANGVITVGQHSGTYNAQLAFSSDGNMYWRDNPSTSYGSWRTLWDSGNFTPSNYLLTTGKAADSNLLDGIDSASFLRSDANDSFSGTLVGSAQRMMEPNNFGKGVYGKYNSSRFQHVWGMGSSWHMSTNGTSLGNFYGIAYTHSNVGAGSQSGFSHQTLFVENGVPRTWIGQGVRTVGDLISDTTVKAPIFYDSNDTNYYVDPTSDSNLHRGKFRANDQANNNYTLAALWTQNYNSGPAGIAFHISGNVGKLLEMRTNGVLYWNNSEVLTTSSGYLPLTGGTLTGDITVGSGQTSSNIYMADSDGTARRIHTNSNRIGFLTSGNGWGSYCFNNGDWKTDMVSYAGASMRAPIFYDSDNTGYYVNLAGTSNINELNVAAKRTDFSSSSGWDAVGFGNATNLHMNGHNQFWIGAGNGTWFTGTANTKSQASGLAADAGFTHDLLITTMPGTSTNDRGITFAVDSNGAGTAGWRLGKFHSGTDATDSMFAVDGQIRAKGGYTDEYDYYADDYSSYYNDGQAHWSGDTAAGWHKPSIVASSAIQIQSGNKGTSTRKPQIQFHQYGWGGPAIEYDGPNRKLQIGMIGGSSANRFNTFSLKFGSNEAFVVNTDYASHNSDMRAPIFYDSNNTDYYVNPASTSNLNNVTVEGALYLNGTQETFFTGVTARKVYETMSASSTQARRYHVARLYTCSRHWDTTWMNIDFKLKEESYNAGSVDYKLTAYYSGNDSQPMALNVRKLEGQPSDTQRYKLVKSSPTAAGWDHSNQPVFYTDVYLDVAYYKQVSMVVDCNGHGYQSTNPTSGAAITVLYDNPSPVNISDFTDSKNTTYTSYDTAIWNEDNLTNVSQLANDSGYLTSLPSHTHNYAPSVHNHDDRYYTETEINAQNVTLNETLAALSGWVPSYSNSDDSSLTWDRTEDALRIKSSSDSTIGAVYKAMRVKDGQTIRVTVTVKGDVPGSDGLYLRLQKHDGNLPDGKTHVSNDQASSSVFVQEDDLEITSWHENSTISTSWVTHEKDVTITGDGYISFLVLNWTGNGVNSIWVKTPDIQIVSSPYLPLSGGTLTGGLYVGGLAEFYSNSHFEYDVNVAGTLDGYLANIDYLGLGAAPNTSGGYRLNMGGNIDMNNAAIDYASQLHFHDNVRFYDDGNDSYLNFKYGDASYGGIKFLNGGGTVKGYVYANAESFGLLDASGNWAVKTAIGAAPLTLSSNSNPEFYVYDSYTVSPGSSRAPIFYDSNNTAYYTNPASTSKLNGLEVHGGDLKMYENGTYSPELRFQNNTHHMGIDYQNNETLRFITRSGVVTVPITFQMRAGTITAANFILSSDERKKTKIVDLPCDNIDVSWRSFEMKDNEGEYRTGVIAQELEQKHPEFVNTDDKGFKSVKYIDLLIAKIAELEARLEKLEK